MEEDRTGASAGETAGAAGATARLPVGARVCREQQRPASPQQQALAGHETGGQAAATGAAGATRPAKKRAKKSFFIPAMPSG